MEKLTVFAHGTKVGGPNPETVSGRAPDFDTVVTLKYPHSR